MRRLAWLACWACLLALLTARAAAATAQSSAPCVVADQQHQLSSGAPRTLEDCLADTAVSQVVIAGDHAVGSDFAKYAGAQEPLRLNRNVTISGPPGLPPHEWPVLDLHFANAVVQLCARCRVTLSRLVLTHERRGAGLAYDIFSGQPGSVVECRDLYRLREACTLPEMQLKALLGLKRSAHLPNSSAPQAATLRDVTYRGKLYRQAVWTEDVTFDAPVVAYDEGREGGASGGYAQGCQQSVRLCEAYVSRECLRTRTADTCIAAVIDSMHKEGQAATGLGTNVKVAIALPMAAGVLAAGVALGCWLVRRCRRRVSDAAAAGGKSKSHRPSTAGGGSSTSTTGGSSDGPRFTRFGPGASKGSGSWELVSRHTSPLITQVDDAAIELGDLIGTGSFGKVFRGRWNSQDVAVKIIEHGGDAVEAVEREMEMMMGFNIPYIVRAFHCATYQHVGANEPSVDLSRQSSSAATRSMSFTAQSPMLTLARQLSGCVPPSGLSFTAAARGTGSSAAGKSSAAGSPAQSGAMPVARRPDAGGAAAQDSSGSHSDVRPLKTLASLDSGKAAGAAAEATAAADAAPLPDQAMALHVLGQRSSRPATSAISDSLDSSVDARCLPRVAGGKDHTCRRFESQLVLQFMDCGSLGAFLGRFQPPAECQGAASHATSVLRLLHLVRDAAQGLQELHANHVLHGDVNARNVLVTSAPDAPLGVRAALADFGLSRTCRQHRTHRTTNTVGTLNHQAPEMLRSGHMSQAADIYALAITMWELYCGQNAFEKLQHPGQFYESVVLADLRPVIPPGMPADLQILMEHCWSSDPAARPSIDRVLQCLEFMVSERQQLPAAGGAGGGVGTPSASAPMPSLLTSQPLRKQQHWWQQPQFLSRHVPLLMQLGSDSGSRAATASSQACSGSLPCTGALRSVALSCSLLPVLDIEQPALAGEDQHGHLMQLQPMAECDAAVAGQLPGAAATVLAPAAHSRQQCYTSQPLPGAARSFSLLRQARAAGSARAQVQQPLQQQQPFQPAPDTSQRTSHDGSDSRGSGGRLPFLSALRQGSFSLRDLSFSSRGTSWSQRHGSQTGSVSLGEQNHWFV